MAYVFTNEQRSDIRSLIRRQPGYEAFREANGNFASRDMTLDIIERAIAHFGLAAEVDAILQRHAARAVTVGTAEAAETALGDIVAGTVVKLNEAEAMSDAAKAEVALADTVLDQLRPFVSDKLLVTVSTALTPIVRDALKPAVEIERVVEVERIVEVSASGKAVAKRHANARKGVVSTFGKVFGVARHAQAAFPVQLWDASDAEPVDPFYVVEPSQMALLVTACERGGNVWLAGPAGGGKSTLPQYYAAKAGSPFVTVAFNRAVETVDIIGQFVLDGAGGMVWQDGILTQAIRRPGTKILLDEIMFAPAGMLALLQTLLSARYLTIHATGEKVPVAEGVVFICADNTRGYGDETGLYVGTVQGNAALIDRMARMIYVDYLPPELESQALANHTGAVKPACERVVAFIGGVRKLAGFENRPMSLRRMIAFVRAVQDGFATETAFEVTMLSRLPDAEREALRQHIRANFDERAFKAEMLGQPVPAAPSSAGEQVGARNTFSSVD